MQNYNEMNQCAKCGGMASVTYKADTFTFTSVGEEYMERKCKICGYVWREKPLDSTPRIHESPADE